MKWKTRIRGENRDKIWILERFLRQQCGCVEGRWNREGTQSGELVIMKIGEESRK